MGEVFVSQVFNKPYWGHQDESGSSDTSPQPPQAFLENPPPQPSHHLCSLSRSHSYSRPTDPCNSVTPFLSTLLPPPPSFKCLFALHSARSPNTCQPSWGGGYTVRNSFERAPQDVIMRIIIRPDGWCYISVPSHTDPTKRPLTSQASHPANQIFSMRWNNFILICNWPFSCINENLRLLTVCLQFEGAEVSTGWFETIVSWCKVEEVYSAIRTRCLWCWKMHRRRCFHTACMWPSVSQQQYIHCGDLFK